MRVLRFLTVAGLAAGLALVPSAAQAAPASKSADLSVALRAPQSAAVGDALTYFVSVTNGGPAGASGVVVTVDVDPSMTFVSASTDQGSCSGTQHVSCSLGNLASGAATSASIQVRASAAGSFSAAAAVQSPTADSNTANDSATASTTVFAPSRVATQTLPAVVAAVPSCVIGCGMLNYYWKITVEMTVVAENGSPISEGFLSFGRFDGCSAPVLAGVATCSFTTYNNYPRQAHYLGSATYAPSDSVLST